MPSTNSQAHGDESATNFPVEDIVQYPLPGYVAPASVAFSPDHKLVSYLYSPDNTLNRKVFAFHPVTCQRHLLVNPPGGGGVDEGNLSTAEKLRGERDCGRGVLV
jgi:dipeptidyl-peptidase-4